MCNRHPKTNRSIVRWPALLLLSVVALAGCYMPPVGFSRPTGGWRAAQTSQSEHAKQSAELVRPATKPAP